MPGGSRQDPTWAFLTEMHELGFQTAARWLAENLHAVGTRSSLDLSLFAEAAQSIQASVRTGYRIAGNHQR